MNGRGCKTDRIENQKSFRKLESQQDKQYSYRLPAISTVAIKRTIWDKLFDNFN